MTKLSTVFFTETDAQNNKAKRIFRTTENNGLFDADKVAIHAYETKTKFTIYIHENVATIFDADADIKATFKVNPRYAKRLTDEKCKNEKFSFMRDLSVTYDNADVNDADKQTKRDKALKELLTRLDVACNALIAKRKADAESAQTDAQSAEQTQTDTEQSAEQTDAQSATESAQTQTDAQTEQSADTETQSAETDAESATDAKQSKAKRKTEQSKAQSAETKRKAQSKARK